jgi:hypothetical protein
MVISNIKTVLQQTAEVTQYPPDVIMSVVDHQFKVLRDYIESPSTTGVRFPYFGLFYPKYKAVVYHLRSLINKLRSDRDNEKLKKTFPRLLKS